MAALFHCNKFTKKEKPSFKDFGIKKQMLPCLTEEER